MFISPKIITISLVLFVKLEIVHNTVHQAPLLLFLSFTYTSHDLIKISDDMPQYHT